MKLDEIYRRLEANKARATKIEDIKPDESDRVVMAAIKGIQAEANKMMAEVEALKADTEKCMAEDKAETEKIRATLENLRREHNQHIDSMAGQAARERAQMAAMHKDEMNSLRAEMDSLRSQLVDAVKAQERAEAERDTLRKVNASLEKKAAVKPVAQPVTMPAAPAARPFEHLDFVVTQRDMNGRIAGGRFTPGKS